MQIIKLPIEQIKPYDNNAKKHTSEQIRHIANSIRKFGFNDPVGIWSDQNICVEGHGRLLALKELGYKEAECIRLDHLTDEERKAYTLAHNQSTLETGFDANALWEELLDISFDMSEFGFDVDESPPVQLERVELKPHTKAHYLISVDINDHDLVLPHIEELRNIGGVEIDSTLN